MSYGGKIAILPGQSEAEEFSTLVHEASHEQADGLRNDKGDCLGFRFTHGLGSIHWERSVDNVVTKLASGSRLFSTPDLEGCRTMLPSSGWFAGPSFPRRTSDVPS
jgi:hypothetical protein